MASSHRNPVQWLNDHVKPHRHRSKRHAQTPDSAVPEAASGQPRENQPPQELPGSQEEPVRQAANASEENASPIRDCLDSGRLPAQAEPPQIEPPQTEPPQTEDVSIDETPIWTRSMQRFKDEHKTLHDAIENRLEDINHLNIVDWDMWLANQPNESKKSENVWFRRCRAYLPSLSSIKTVALNLSRLDPHSIAPWVVGGVFLAVELCFNSVDPLARDTAMSTILKANTTVSKWLDAEPDLHRMMSRSRSADIGNIEKQLGALYFESLVLVSSVYKAGLSKTSRADSEDPEPTHQTVKERTGIDDSESTAGKWFLETTEFSSWIDQIRNRDEAAQSAFWLKGSMGTGKTTLMCRVISNFDEAPVNRVRFIPYYCFGSQTSTKSETTYVTILRALCCRLAWNSDGSVAGPARQLHDNSKTSLDSTFTEKTTESLFKSLLAYSKTPIVFVIDALDECKDEKAIDSLLKFLVRIRQEHPDTYFLLSSRPHVNVADYFEDSIEIFKCVQPETEKEMATFIRSQIDSKRHEVKWKKSVFFEDDDLRKRLERALLRSADGMFRWVQIWLGIFFPMKAALRRPEYVTKLLDDLENPRSLRKVSEGENDQSIDEDKKVREAYKRLWNAADEQYKEYQTRLFRIIIGALDPIYPQQLLEAVSVDPDNPDKEGDLKLDELEALYCNFLEQDSHGYLDFEHISAKMFVTEMKGEGSDKSLFSKECDYAIADIAIKLLERPDHWVWQAAKINLAQLASDAKMYLTNIHTLPKPKLILTMNDHFGQYMFQCCFRHLGRLTDDAEFGWRIHSICVDEQLGPMVFGILQYHSVYGRSDSSRLLTTCSPQQDTCSISPLLLMMSLNFSPFTYDIACALAIRPSLGDLTVINILGENPLHLACELGRTAMVEDLLKFERARRGSCLSLLMGRDNNGGIPMHHAREEATFKILLRYEMLDFKVDLADNDSCISKQLDCEDSSGNTHVTRIIRICSDEFSARLLTRYRLGPNNSVYEMMWEATKGRRIQAIKVLKNMPIACTKEPGEGYLEYMNPPLHQAAVRGDMEMIDLLIDWDMGIHTVGSEYGTVICAAAASGDPEVVQYFLGRGAEVNDIWGGRLTALGQAVIRGNEDMVRLLLDKGADVNAKGGDFGTVLGLAAYSGQKDVVRLLLDKGADINAKVGSGDITPIEFALDNGWLWKDMFRFLLDNGADPGLLSEDYKAKLERVMEQETE
ncbi:hypothetical protein GGR52DRAFT_581880 [Hypoxylon sp. FL1284]|nr:hypothetical protein GGR52DRAFT_581880 [Hypoxylon sp. FL1284]